MKFCGSCGQQLEDSDLFCTSCGVKQGQLNYTNNELQGSTEQVSSQKSKKKKIIIPIVIVIALLVIGLVVYFVFFAGKDKEEEVSEDNNLGITVDGEFYEFTVEEGIKDYNDIQGGVVFQSVSDSYSLQFRPDGEEEAVGIEQLDTFTWVDLGPMDMDGNEGMVFSFRSGYEIDGITGFATEEELREAGYVGWMQHQMIATENGNVDVYEYLDDCMRVYVEGTFDVAPYMLDVAEGSPEARRSEYIIEDDVDGFFEYYVEGFYTGMSDGELRKLLEDNPDVLNMFAYCDIRTQFLDGNIEMVIFKNFTLVPEDRTDVEHLLRIHIYVQGDKASEWEDSWK